MSITAQLYLKMAVCKSTFIDHHYYFLLSPFLDLMGPNGQTLYGVAGDSCSVMHQQQHCNSGKLQSPSHQSSGCRVMPTNVRHLVDLSSGSTCCSSSTSSSPHTLMQGPPPPVPSLPASLAQGVLFAPGELTESVGGGGSPGHYGSQHSNQQHQQYATQQYHPYLMSTSTAQHLATLPRHYEASMATLTSPMKLYSEDQLVVSFRPPLFSNRIIITNL